MPFAQCMSILYRKESINEADHASSRHDFVHPDDVHMRRPVEMFDLRWDGNIPDLCFQSNDAALIILSADTASVDDDFLTNLKIAYSSCSYLYDESTRRKGHGLI